MPKFEMGVQGTSEVRLVEGKVVPVVVGNNLPRPLGLEIELSQIGYVDDHSADAPLKYVRTRDGSVNGDQAELVLPPLLGDEFVKRIGEFAVWLAQWGAGADESCGLHVHVGANDLGYFELRRLVMLMARLEPELYRVVAPGRGDVGGLRRCYCIPLAHAPEIHGFLTRLRACTHTEEIKAELLAWLYEGIRQGGEDTEVILANARAIAKKKGHKYETCRYFGLNLHSWMMRGTVEFRHHQGTIAPEALTWWPLLCGWVVEAARALTDQEVRGCKGLMDLLETTFKRPLGKEFRIPEPIHEWVEATIRRE